MQTTSTSVSAPTVAYPHDAVITVTVTGQLIFPNPVLPTGQVNLTVSGGSLPSPLNYTQSLQADEAAHFTVPGLNPGVYALQAQYLGDANFSGSQAGGRLTVT